MTIERWTLVSDGKRYHNLQRDMQGEYVEFNEYERDIVALKSLVINRLIDMGGSVPPDTPFNRLVDLLIMAVEKKTADRCNKFGMFAPEVLKAAEELTQRYPHAIDADEQTFRTAQVIQEVLDRQPNPLGAGTGMDGKVIA